MIRGFHYILADGRQGIVITLKNRKAARQAVERKLLGECVEFDGFRRPSGDPPLRALPEVPLPPPR